MIKRVVLVCFLSCLIFILCSCGGGGSSSPDQAESPVNDSEDGDEITQDLLLEMAPEQWAWRTPLPQGNNVNGIAHDANGTYVAVADAGTVITFSDPATITTANTQILSLENLKAVAFGDGTFVAVGMGRTIITSSDGLTWTPRVTASQATDNLYRLAYGNNTFVAAGNGFLYTSSDGGITWQRNDYPFSVTKLSYANNSFVAVAGQDIFTSVDGLTWVTIENNLNDVLFGIHSYLSEVKYAANEYVATTVDGILISSPNLSDWTRESSYSQSTGEYYPFTLNYGNGVYVTVGGGYDYGVIYTSLDKVSWARQISSQPLKSILFDGNSFIAMGVDGIAVESTDGFNWTETTEQTTEYDLKSVVYGNGRHIAVGKRSIYEPSVHVLLSSFDGESWTELPPLPGNKDITRIRFFEGLFYLVCSDSLMTSSDGIAWTTLFSGSHLSNPYFRDVVYANGMYVLVGRDWILSSADGLNWVERDTLPTSVLCVTYGEGIFVIAGAYGTILTSRDGINWIDEEVFKFEVQTPDSFYDVAYGNGYFVVVGENGTLYSSDDGSNWTNRVEGNNSSFSNIIHTQDGFFAVGNSVRINAGFDGTELGTLYVSPNGIDWAGLYMPVQGWFEGISHDNVEYVIIGTGGTIIQSESL